MPRPRRLLLAVAGGVLFLAVSLALARYLTSESRERDAIRAVLIAQAHGDAPAMLRHMSGCAGDPACAVTTRRNAQRLRRAGKVKIVRLDSDTSYALGSAEGPTRIVWTVLPGRGDTVVQCADIRRGGNALFGRTVTLRRLSAPIGRESSCR